MVLLACCVGQSGICTTSLLFVCVTITILCSQSMAAILPLPNSQLLAFSCSKAKMEAHLRAEGRTVLAVPEKLLSRFGEQANTTSSLAAWQGSFKDASPNLWAEWVLGASVQEKRVPAVCPPNESGLACVCVYIYYIYICISVAGYCGLRPLLAEL